MKHRDQGPGETTVHVSPRGQNAQGLEKQTLVKSINGSFIHKGRDPGPRAAPLGLLRAIPAPKVAQSSKKIAKSATLAARRHCPEITVRTYLSPYRSLTPRGQRSKEDYMRSSFLALRDFVIFQFLFFKKCAKMSTFLFLSVKMGCRVNIKEK